MFVEINVSNFSEVQDQFKNMPKGYLNSGQIMDEITKQVNEDIDNNHIQMTLFVSVQPENFDSADACFSLIGFVNKEDQYSFVYQYNGTAK